MVLNLTALQGAKVFRLMRVVRVLRVLKMAKTMDGVNSTLFSKDAQRNQAMIAMLGGEVYRDKLVVTGKNSDWEEKQGVKFVCRGGIPPQMGEFDGYISVGFTQDSDFIG